MYDPRANRHLRLLPGPLAISYFFELLAIHEREYGRGAVQLPPDAGLPLTPAPPGSPAAR